MKKIINKKIYLVIAAVFIIALSSLVVFLKVKAPMQVKILIIPKFEVDKMQGDFPGEAQYFYEEYFADSKEYEITGNKNGKLYYNNGFALYIAGMGKVNSGLNLLSLLDDERFDFTDAYVISTGCAGGSTGKCVMGDVIVGTAVVDFDLGHHVDAQYLSDPGTKAWYRDTDYDDPAYKILNQELTEAVYKECKDIKLETTEKTKEFMSKSFQNAKWATREPVVMKGTVVTSDVYWKGDNSHDKAIEICNSYNVPDEYAASEMEDMAIALALEKRDMLDRYIIIRGIVDEDTFMGNQTPKSLWGAQEDNTVASDDSEESGDIFRTLMKNIFLVGKSTIEYLAHSGDGDL